MTWGTEWKDNIKLHLKMRYAKLHSVTQFRIGTTGKFVQTG
jgi:hypothetical protein